MKKVLLLASIMAIVLLLACDTPYIISDYQPLYPDLEVEFIPLENAESESLEIIIAPSIIELDHVNNGDIIDTWTNNGQVEFNNNIVTYQKGDRFCLFIVNDNGQEMVYQLEYLEARKDTVFSDDGSGGIILNNGKGYAKAPFITRTWVSFPQIVVVPDNQIAKVPIYIAIPKTAEIPNTWAFRIGVSMKVSESINYESSPYFLMKR